MVVAPADVVPVPVVVPADVVPVTVVVLAPVLDDAKPGNSASESCRQELGFSLAHIASPPLLTALPKIDDAVKLNVPARLFQPRPLQAVPCSYSVLSFSATGDVREEIPENVGEEPSPTTGSKDKGVIDEVDGGFVWFPTTVAFPSLLESGTL